MINPMKTLGFQPQSHRISRLIFAVLLSISCWDRSYGVGASVPFVEYEAESGVLNGGATVQSLSGPPTTPYSSPQLEASGRAFVRLNSVGQSVRWTNNTGANVTAINLRYCIPDSSTGRGFTATLNLYVNGTFRQAVTLTSAQTWQYDGAFGSSTYNTSNQNPADGNPRDFFDETHFLVTGSAISPGSTITLKKDSANTAAF
jgi:hypothetical protein